MWRKLHYLDVLKGLVSGLGTGTRLTDLELTAVQVRLDRGVQERGDRSTRVRGVRAHVQVGVTEGLADRVDAVVVRGGQEVLALEVAEADRVGGRPRRTEAALREQLLRRQDRLRIGLLSCRVAVLLGERGGRVAALRVGIHNSGVRRVVGQGSLGLQAAHLHTLAEELRAAVRIHYGDEDNNSGDHSTEADEAILG